MQGSTLNNTYPVDDFHRRKAPEIFLSADSLLYKGNSLQPSIPAGCEAFLPAKKQIFAGTFGSCRKLQW